jgi:3-hydroxybutyryl-CoA dehydrogenase
MKIKKVGIVGCGTMGSGIAIASAHAGYETLVNEASDELLKRGLDSISRWLSKRIEKGKLTEEDREKTLSNLKGAPDMADLKGCQIVIEAAFEDLDLKKGIFERLDELCNPEAILASNTSVLSIIDIAAATKRPDKVIGTHFFNPAQTMKLLEIIRSIVTSDETFNIAVSFGKSLGKEPVSSLDRCGFIVNRLMFPYWMESIRALEEGVASVEDIDKAMMLGVGLPMGPFTLMDFSGLDVTLDVANRLYEEHKDRKYAPPILLKKMVAAGHLGRKTNKGFYDYSK